MPSPNPAGPRPWLWSAPVPNVARALLVYFWTYGKHWQPEDPLPKSGEIRVFPLKSTIREDFGGLAAGTLDDWLGALSAGGWIKWVGNGWRLAVERPVEEWAVEASARAAAAKTRAAAAKARNATPAIPAPPPGSQPTPGITGDTPGITGGGTRDPGPPPPGSRPHNLLKNLPKEPAKEPAKQRSDKRKPRTPKPPAQAGLQLTHPEPPKPPTDADRAKRVAAELRGAHEAARMKALHAVGKPRTKLPGPRSANGKALDLALAHALATEGEAWCRAYVAHRAAEWLANPAQLAYPPHCTWGPKGIAHGKRVMAGGGRNSNSWQTNAEPNPKATPAERQPASQESARW